MNKGHCLSLLSICFGLLASCSQMQPEAINARAIDKTSPQYSNPFTPDTYEYFVASKEYPKTYGTYTNKKLIDQGGKKKKVIICIGEQRGRYYINDQVAMDFPISTGVSSFPTKTGEYTIIGKKADHVSNLYGRMYDAEGKCINGDAQSSDPVPEGGKFVGSSMPYWMRMTNAGLGMHVGRVARRPLSHGCIRLQNATARSLFQQLPVGTPVSVRQQPEEWNAIPTKPLHKTP